jgi:hypothetical protein
MTEQPPITPPPKGANVDEATKQAIAEALQPIVDAQSRHDTALTTLSDRLDERGKERAAEHERFMQRFDSLDSVKVKRDTQIAERPTHDEVAALITRAITTMTMNVDAAITKAINPLILELAGVNRAVNVRLGDRDEGLQRHEREIEGLATRVANVEQQMIRHMEYIADVRRALYGDSGAKDGAPNVFGELSKIERLLMANDASLRKFVAAESELSETRLLGIEKRLTPIEDYIKRQIESETARAERRRKFREAVFAVGKNSPLWLKIVGVVSVGSGIGATLAELIRAVLGL